MRRPFDNSFAQNATKRELWKETFLVVTNRSINTTNRYSFFFPCNYSYLWQVSATKQSRRSLSILYLLVSSVRVHSFCVRSQSSLLCLSPRQDRFVVGSPFCSIRQRRPPVQRVLFGGLTKAGDYLFKPTHHHMEAHMMPIFKNKVKLLPSQLTDKNAAVLGAGALIWKEMEKEGKAFI